MAYPLLRKQIVLIYPMKPINFAKLDLNLLRVLDCLLIERSTTRAAERLHLSQSAVSAALGRLRTTLDDQLFERKGQALAPTPYASSIEGELRELLTRLECTLNSGQTFVPSESRLNFRLGASDYYADYLMPSLVNRLQREAPLARIQLIPLDPHDHVNSLERFQSDAIIFLSTPIPSWMRSQDVMLSQFRIIARKDNAMLKQCGLANGAQIPLDVYCGAQHGLYSPSGESRTWVDIELEKRDKIRTITATTSTFHSLAKIIANTDLIATVPQQTALDMATHYPLEIYIHPLEGISSKLMMAWHYRNDRKEEQAWFRNIIIQELSQLQTSLAEPNAG